VDKGSRVVERNLWRRGGRQRKESSLPAELFIRREEGVIVKPVKAKASDRGRVEA